MYSGSVAPQTGAAAPAGDLPAPRQGVLGRLWAYGLGLEPAAAAAALPVPADIPKKESTMGIAYSVARCITFLLGFLALLGAGAESVTWTATMTVRLLLALTLCFLCYPMMVFQRLHRQPLAVEEVRSLFPGTGDSLEHAYLTLVTDAIRQKVPAEAARDMRRAFCALAEAMDRLPPVYSAANDTGTLRQEALAVLAEARKETDQVAAASLLRQAEAIERHAAAGDRFNVLAHRVGVLRRELTAQIEALRAGLAVFNIDAAPGAYLTHLADSVRRVAAEAASVAVARDELDTCNAPGDAPQQARLRLGGR